MKKIFKTMLAALLCCGMFTACDDDDMAYQDIEVTYQGSITYEERLIAGPFSEFPEAVTDAVNYIERKWQDFAEKQTFKVTVSGNTLADVYVKADLQMAVKAASSFAAAEALMLELRTYLEMNEKDFEAATISFSGITFSFRRLLGDESSKPILVTKQLNDLKCEPASVEE